MIRATPVIPDMKLGKSSPRMIVQSFRPNRLIISPGSHLAFFRCMVCQHTQQEEIDRGRINEPNKCPREQCGAQGTMSLIHNRSEFADKQVVRLQETPGEQVMHEKCR